MPTFAVSGINIGSFNLGESDKVLTIFSAERGLIRAVAKGARKPGSKITGKSEPLNVNKLLIAKGRSLDIITQAESIETFHSLRKDLTKLSIGLYYAELTQQFGQGLSEESNEYFDYMQTALKQLVDADPEESIWLCLKFELGLLQMLGFQPELTYCVVCRQIIDDLSLAAFDRELGGTVCSGCYQQSRISYVRERTALAENSSHHTINQSVQMTPLVWKQLILAQDIHANPQHIKTGSRPLKQALLAAQRLIQGYIEHRAGRKLKALALIGALD